VASPSSTDTECGARRGLEIATWCLPVRDCSILKRRPGQDNGAVSSDLSSATRMKPKTSSFSALSQGGGRAEAKVERHSKEPQSTSCVLPEPSEAPAPSRRWARTAPVSGAALRAEQLRQPPSRARAA